MTLPFRLCVLLLLLAVPAFSAPVPVEPEDPNAWQRVLPEDTDAVLVIDYKAFLGSPLVKKGLMGKLPKYLADYVLVPIELKPLGIDPVKDVRRAAVIMARSYWDTPEGGAPGNGGVVIVLETAKSSAALRDKFDELAKEGKHGVKVLDEKKAKLYEVKAPGSPAYFTILPGGTVVMSPAREVALAAVARMKAGGRKFKHEAMGKFVKGLKAGPVINGLILGEAVISASSSGAIKGGVVEKRKTTLHTLAEAGFQSVRIDVKAKDTLKATVDMECKDKDAAEAKARELKAGIEMFKPLIDLQAMKEPKFKAVASLLGSLKVTAVGKAVRFEGEADADAVAALDLIPLPGK